MKNDEYITTNIRVEKDLYKSFKEIAKKRGIPVSYLIRQHMLEVVQNDKKLKNLENEDKSQKSMKSIKVLVSNEDWDHYLDYLNENQISIRKDILNYIKSKSNK